MRIAFGGLSVLNLTVLGAFYLASLIPGVLVPRLRLLPFGLGSILLFGLGICVVHDLAERLRRRTKVDAKEAGEVMNALVWAEMVRGGRRGLLCGALAFGLLNVGLELAVSERCQAYEENGRYVLKSHSTVVRELTEEEYVSIQQSVIRAMSSWMMMFTLGAVIFFVKVYPVAKAAIPPKPPKAIPVRPA